MMLKYACRHYFFDGSLGLTQELEELSCSLAPWFYDLFGIRGNHVTQVYMCVPAEHDVWQPSTSLSLSLFLRINLYELMKNNSFQGFSLSIVRRFTFSVLKCLQMLYVEKIIHCDLKPVSTSWPAGGTGCHHWFLQDGSEAVFIKRRW